MNLPRDFRVHGFDNLPRVPFNQRTRHLAIQQHAPKLPSSAAILIMADSFLRSQ